MDAIVMRQLIFRAPFVPFTLRMNDGREFYVRHPELISVALSHVYLIDDKTERGIFLDSMLIASIQQDEREEL